MDRRLFLQVPLLSLATSALANFERPRKGFKVEANKDRFQEEMYIMGGRFNCIVSSRDTEGDLCIYNTTRQEKGGPALHFHHQQDEWFYVVKGQFLVQVGEDRFMLNPGDSAFAPRIIPHAFAKIDDGESQMLVLFQPAGSMEAFFKEVKATGTAIAQNLAKIKELSANHGMEVVGPPLKF